VNAESLSVIIFQALINQSHNINGMKFPLQKIVEELEWCLISKEKLLRSVLIQLFSY
jgi:hypothetical protein